MNPGYYIHYIYNKHKKILKIRKEKEDCLATIRSRGNDTVVSSLEHLFVIYPRPVAKETSKLKTPTGT